MNRRSLLKSALLALAARLVRETGALINGAARANKSLATFGLDAEVRFAKPADRAAFVGELTDALTGIISKYHTETGRPHRLIVAVHPSITATSTTKAHASSSTAPTRSCPRRATAFPAASSVLPPRDSWRRRRRKTGSTAYRCSATSNTRSASSNSNTSTPRPRGAAPRGRSRSAPSTTSTW